MPLLVLGDVARVIFGLFKGMYMESLSRGLEYWLAAMEPGLQKMLSKFGLGLKQMGAPMSYYGEVIPYHASIDGLQVTGGRVSIEAVKEALFLDPEVARAVTGFFRASADAGRPSLERQLRDGLAPAPMPEDRLRTCLAACESGGLAWKGPAPPLARLPSADHLRERKHTYLAR